MNKQEGIDIVNEIIKEIANRGRQFFKYNDKVGYLFERNNKIFYHSEYLDIDICFSIPYYHKPKRWHHGGTLLALIKDFKNFIQTGEKSNGLNGYGGLYCPHWGYDGNDMEIIREKAEKLGYPL